MEKAKLTISRAFEILIMKKTNTLDLDSYRKTDLEMFSRAINLSSLDWVAPACTLEVRK